MAMLSKMALEKVLSREWWIHVVLRGLHDTLHVLFIKIFVQDETSTLDSLPQSLKYKKLIIILLVVAQPVRLHK